MEQFFAIFCFICLMCIVAMTFAYIIARLRTWYYRRKLKQSVHGIPKDNSPVPVPASLPVPILFKTFEVDEDFPFVSYADFITCETKGEYKCLIRSGTPSKDELYAAWMNTLSQYHQLIGSKDAATYIKRVAKIESIHTKIFQVEKIIKSLRAEGYCERKIECLKIWEYKMAFTRESLDKDLVRIEVALSNERLKLEIQRKEYEKEQKGKKGTGGKPTKENYMRTLFVLEKHRQMRYNPSQLPLYDFCIFYKDLEDYNKQLKIKNIANGSR